MIGGPYRTNPPFSVSISMKTRWDPTTLVWSSTDTNERNEGILIWIFSRCCFINVSSILRSSRYEIKLYVCFVSF